MRILRTLTVLAPFILKGPTKRPVRALAGVLASWGLIFLSILFLSIALFIYVSREYGADIAFLSIGLLALVAAIYLQVSRKLKIKARVSKLEDGIEKDPLASKIPQNMKDDPVIGSILKQINDHPVPATAAAVTLGMVIANQYFGD
ncbi:hypothetical protein N9W89_06325 [Hellea sp.]|nr:hypothetical protein [Hellea sp.]